MSEIKHVKCLSVSLVHIKIENSTAFKQHKGLVEVCCFRYQWEMKYNSESPVWGTDLWIWRLIRILRHDFTTHGDNYFICGCNNCKVNSRKTLFVLQSNSPGLVIVASCEMMLHCIVAKVDPWFTFFQENYDLVSLLHDWTGPIQMNEGAVFFHAGLMQGAI